MAQQTTAAEKWRYCILITASAALFGAMLLYGRVGEEFEARSWDWRVRIVAPGQLPDSKVRIINIDQSSLDTEAGRGNLWPFPRGLYEVVLLYLQHAGARAVAFDILFTEQSAVGVEEDVALANAMSSTLPSIAAVALRSSKTQESEEAVEAFLKRQRSLVEAQRPNLEAIFKRAHTQTPGITLPVPELIRAAAGFGNVQGLSDSDGIFRHTVPAQLFRDTPVLSLPFALFAADALSGKAGEISADWPLTVRLYGKKWTIPTYSFSRIIESWLLISEGKLPLVPVETFKDTYVFVGMDAPGLLDLRPTSIDESFPGVEYNATILENFVRKDFITKVPLLAGIVIILLPCFFIAYVNLFFVRILAQTGITVLVFLGMMGGATLSASLGVWMPAVIPLGMGMLTLTATLALQYALEGRQRRFLRNAFRYYVSSSVIDQIVNDPAQLTLGGEKRELTIFFSDIAGFTSISESVEAAKLVPLLNDYLSAVTGIILSSGGTVDKYVGDAVVAFWNAPLTIEDHAMRAVEAALDVQSELKRMAPEFERTFGVTVKTRIGLNTGTVNVGNFGSRDRFNYTVIGDAANLASRLEGANKYFGTPILIAERTYELLRGLIICRKVADIRVVGRAGAVAIYEPLVRKGQPYDIDTFEAFHAALKLFEQGNLYDALDAFRSLIRDPIARVYVSRIERDIAKGLRDWSHVWQLTEK